MSAYMCEPELIMALALALHQEGLEIAGASDAFSLFDRLRDKNIQAMDTCYPGRWNQAEEAAYPEDLAAVMHSAADHYLPRLLPAGADARGIIQEFDYQASECQDWDDSPEALALSSLQVILQAREEETRPAREAAARAAKAQAAEAERARIVAAFPFLEQAGTSKRSGQTLAAHNLRRELRRAFSGVKFSVISSSFSMGNSVSVAWTDGPTRAAVEEIADKYKAGTFDGMDDCYTYNSGLDRVWGETFGSSKFVHVDHREFSDAAYAWAVPLVLARWASSGDTIPDWTPAQVRRGLFNYCRIQRAGEYLATLVYQLLNVSDASAWSENVNSNAALVSRCFDEA